MHKYTLKSPDETETFGISLGKLCRSGDIICLKGALGAGKTRLTQAIAAGCGVDEREYVSSPTYALFHQYNGETEFYHMDFYRLKDADDVIDNGLDEYFYQSGISVIEWYEIAAELLPDTCLYAALAITGELERTISLTTSSGSWQKRLETLSVTLKNN